MQQMLHSSGTPVSIPPPSDLLLSHLNYMHSHRQLGQTLHLLISPGCSPSRCFQEAFALVDVLQTPNHRRIFWGGNCIHSRSVRQTLLGASRVSVSFKEMQPKMVKPCVQGDTTSCLHACCLAGHSSASHAAPPESYQALGTPTVV